MDIGTTTKVPPLNHHDDLGALTRATRALSESRTVPEVLDEIVAQTARCLPEFEHVTVSRIHEDGRLDTLAATTQLARDLDAAQSDARSGPCVEAGKLDEVVWVDDARHEQRWPRYMAVALRLGLTSQLGIRLVGDRDGAVCLNLHSTTTTAIDPAAVGVAEHFAVQAGAALGHLQTADQLSTAVQTRTLIGTALGLVMERYGLTRDQAFGYLVRESSSQNKKLRAVAQELVESKEREVADERAR